MEEGREWKRGGNGSGGGMDDRKKNIPFRRKPESHSRDSENFPRSGTLQWSPVGECGCRRRDSGFRRNGNVFYFGAHSFFRNWPMRQRWGNKFPRKFRITINCGARYIFFKEKNISHSRESGNLPVILTVLERDAGRQLEVGEIPAFAGMGVRGEGMGGGRIYKSPSIHAFKSSISS